MEVSLNSFDPAALRRWLAATPPGASVLLSAEQARALAAPPSLPDAPPAAVAGSPSPDLRSWRERLWVVPAETLLTSAEAAEALGLSRDAIHRRTARKRSATLSYLPHQRVDGLLLFRAGELRAWVEQFEHRDAPALTSLDAPSRRTRSP